MKIRTTMGRVADAACAAPAGALVSLRTTAADAAGSSIAETITTAYLISS